VREGVFLVPQTAVLQNESGFFVFTVEDGKAAMRPVKTGDWVGTDWAILEGLKAGDRVIIDNLVRLRPGIAVTRASAKPAAPTPATPAPAPKSAGK
jgi:membrane fusion protein (multidrug efflux system)